MDPVEDYLRYRDDSEDEDFLFYHFPTIGEEFNNPPYSYSASGDPFKTKKGNIVLPQIPLKIMPTEVSIFNQCSVFMNTLGFSM